MRILLTGGSGLLGSHLQKLIPDALVPRRSELDITDWYAVSAYVASHGPDVIIHAAAITNNRHIEDDPAPALEVNIKGTVNLALACLRRRTRLVYLSTDYVYRGDRGNYSENDEIEPFNLYAWTKLGGEAAVRAVPNHLIIRTSFGAEKFEYDAAFSDKWTSKEYVDVIAPQVLEAAQSPLTGVLHIGGSRRTMLDYAKHRNPEVRSISVAESGHKSPVDSSLNLDRWNAYHKGRVAARSHLACRICGSVDLRKYLDLGMMPLANNLAPDAATATGMDRFPLQVAFCPACSLSQTTVVIDPELLFKRYAYRSSVNKAYVRHCTAMARSVAPRLQLDRADLVVDVAGNDGTLLKEFANELGVRVLNVDPAENIAALAEADGVPTVTDFWSMDVAERIVKDYGRPKLITATNVFAHVDDLPAFLAAAAHCLHDDGALILEFPYVADFIDKHEFDTVYFEHLSYIGMKPVIELAARMDMDVFDVEQLDIHGGSLRVFMGKRGARPRSGAVDRLLTSEHKAGFHGFAKYETWSQEVNDLIGEINAQLTRLNNDGATLAAFAASAKGNTLLNTCRLNTRTIEYIVDDTPEKIGRYSPGTGIPIVDRARLAKDPPDYLLILAWNFAAEIIESAADFRRAGGKFIIPVPRFEIVE